jgi:trans-2,3-dihydro-3-hydroxyanthranilate isomerase
MSRHQFYQLDVFTRQPLSGNPLAVFPDARGLETPTMQALAREMNLSETTFVTPSEQATRRVRFFTPAAEIPLAGHPTIGTWWLLAELGQLESPKGGEVAVAQETGGGVLPVHLSIEGGRPRRVTMTQRQPEFGAVVPDRKTLAEALGGDPGMLTDLPPQLVSTALPQLMVPVRSRADLEALPSGGTGGELASYLQILGTQCAMCFALDADAPGTTARCRMFAPGLGVPEDPATGSAAGALGAYLVRHGLVSAKDGEANLVFDQGIEISRPSRMFVTVTTTPAGGITEVRVGGEAVTIIVGEVTL